MNEHWDRVGRLFERVVSAAPAERDALIAQSGESDDVRHEVRSLVAAHCREGSFLDAPAVPPPSEAALEAEAAETPLLPRGATVGPYLIGGVIGRGGMGVVYDAEDLRLHRRVALKSLSPSLARDERQRERLKREARAAAALTHPGIATVYALEEIDGQWFIASEYLDGETLRTELEHGAMDPERARATALEVARAMAAAHERGVVHRDLKPENVIRVRGGPVKILDFGLAHFTVPNHPGASGTRLTETGHISGTPLYMAPEQLLGRDIDPRTDQFAFGVLLYELYTARHPFGGSTLASTIAHVLALPATPPALPREMPESTWHIVERCLQKDPAHRFERTQDLVSALERAALVPPAAPVPPASLAYTVAPAPPAAPAAPVPPVSPPPPPALAWWRIHQLMATLAQGIMVWPVWYVHRSWGRPGLMVFLLFVAAVAVAGSLRVHLWFAARVYPEDLSGQRQRSARWIRAAETVVVAILVIGGITLPEDRAGWASLFIAFGIISGLSFVFVEPATARAAFRD